MIPNGVRMAGTIPYRNRVKVKWSPKTVSPWWDTVGDTINNDFPYTDYGFTPGFGKEISGGLGNVTYMLSNSGAYSFQGDTLCGVIGRPMSLTMDFGIVWENGDQGPFSAQDQIRFGISTGRGAAGTDSYIVFAHDKAAFAPPGENWQCMCAYDHTQPNSASFSADSGVVPGPVQQFKITISADGQTITWFINGTQVAQVVGDPTHIYFDPAGAPIIASGENVSIYNAADFNFASDIIVM